MKVVVISNKLKKTTLKTNQNCNAEAYETEAIHLLGMYEVPTISCSAVLT